MFSDVAETVWNDAPMLWSFRLFLLFFLPFVAAAADHHLLGGALGDVVGGLMRWTGF